MDLSAVLSCGPVEKFMELYSRYAQPLKEADFLGSAYFYTAIMLILLCDLICPELLRHGRGCSGVSKNIFKYFYFFGLMVFIPLYSVSPVANLFWVHLLRRFVECMIFRYSGNSRMNYFQVLHGFLYFLLISVHLSDKEMTCKIPFILLNVVQFLAHWYVFTHKEHLFYLHYLAEVAIYVLLAFDIGTTLLLLNSIYVMIFAYMSIADKAGNKLYLTKSVNGASSQRVQFTGNRNKNAR
jgi:hypothetical protein